MNVLDPRGMIDLELGCCGAAVRRGVVIQLRNALLKDRRLRTKKRGYAESPKICQQE